MSVRQLASSTSKNSNSGPTFVIQAVVGDQQLTAETGDQRPVSSSDPPGHQGEGSGEVESSRNEHTVAIGRGDRHIHQQAQAVVGDQGKIGV